MIKYKTDDWQNKIEKIEAVRETEKCVWISKNWGTESDEPKNRKYLKRGRYENFFDTYDEAKQYLMQEAQTRIDGLRNSLQYKEKRLAEICRMKEEK